MEETEIYLQIVKGSENKVDLLPIHRPTVQPAPFNQYKPKLFVRPRRETKIFYISTHIFRVVAAKFLSHTTLAHTLRKPMNNGTI